MKKTTKIFNIIKVISILLFKRRNSVRNILIKYPEMIFNNSSDDKDEILEATSATFLLMVKKLEKN